MSLSSLTLELHSFANPTRAAHSSRYFKTGPGQYGAGDQFLGLNTPQMRALGKKYCHLPLADIDQLLQNPIHEYRSIAAMILVHQYPSSPQAIYDFYLAHSTRFNNWDLVDISAPNIVGQFLHDKKDRSILFTLAQSSNLWQRRISIISTLTFIKHNQLADTLKISRLLLSDKEDLIHKAVGWMLRELGKKDQPLLEKFLQDNYSQLPRTALRYAIEKFPPSLRQTYLSGQF